MQDDDMVPIIIILCICVCIYVLGCEMRLFYYLELSPPKPKVELSIQSILTFSRRGLDSPTVFTLKNKSKKE